MVVENVRGFRSSPLMVCGWTVLCNVADGRAGEGVVFRGPQYWEERVLGSRVFEEWGVVDIAAAGRGR